MKHLDSIPNYEGLREQTKKLENQVKLLKFSLLIIAICILASFWTSQAKSETQADSLKLRRLAIVDDKGIERVVLGAPLPEPLTLGKRFPRGGQMSGILLFDEEGNERSGYVTADGYPNVMFTLDSLARQQTLFLTEPHGSTSFWIFDSNDNSFQLDVRGDTPTMKLVKNGKEIYKQPNDKKKDK